MTIHSLQTSLSFARRSRRWAGASPTDPIADDLPPTLDPRQTLPRASVVLLAATIPVVALTAQGQVGAGFAFRDVVALLMGYGVIMLALARLPWTRLPADWSWALIAAQLLFVVSLTTMTGGGASPYFALYAPTLAIAGWHLRGTTFILVVATTAILEVWRAVVLGGAGSLSQVTIGLPFFAALGLIALLTARRLSAVLVTLRQDQRRMADTLAALQAFAWDPAVDPLPEVGSVAERVFGRGVRAVAFEPPIGAFDRLSDQVLADDLVFPITGASSTYGLLTMDRSGPLSSTERRLAYILADTAGRAMDAHRLHRQQEMEREAVAGTGNAPKTRH